MAGVGIGVGGMSRRELIRRGGVAAGTLVWAVPAIESFTSPAFGAAAGTPPPTVVEGQAISFVALLLKCGGKLHRIKFEAPFPSGTLRCATGAPAVEFGRTFAVADCGDQLRRGDRQVSAACPSVSARFDPLTGSLTVDTGSCTLVDFVVKCGIPSDPDDQGCEDPGEGNQPAGALRTSGLVTFVPCLLGDETPNKKD